MRRDHEAAGRYPILLIDDDPVVRQFILMQFERMRLRNAVIEASNSDEGQQILSEPGIKPVLAFLDIFMPGRSGLELLRWLREESDHRDLTVIMLTVSGELAKVDEAYSLGISSYLVKPVGFGALQNAIQQAALPWMVMPPEKSDDV